MLNNLGEDFHYDDIHCLAYEDDDTAGVEGDREATDSSGDASRGTPGVEGYGGVRGFALEGSNVDVAEELIAMIMAQRSYELTSKAISTADEMLQMTNQLK